MRIRSDYPNIHARPAWVNRRAIKWLNPNPTQARAARAEQYQKRVDAVREWLQENDSGITRHEMISIMPMSLLSMTISHYAQEYAGIDSCQPRAARRLIMRALGIEE
jgi:hypothetical protein